MGKTVGGTGLGGSREDTAKSRVVFYTYPVCHPLRSLRRGQEGSWTDRLEFRGGVGARDLRLRHTGMVSRWWLESWDWVTGGRKH